MRRTGRSARIVAAIAIGALGLAASRSSVGAPPSVESLVTLQWTAPGDTCPDAAYVYTEIGRLLGPTSPTTEDAHVNARAKVTPAADGFHVELTTEVGGTKGARSLDAQTCRGAADATALIVAFLVNPTRVTSSVSPNVSVPVPVPGSPSTTAPSATPFPSSSTSAPAPTTAPTTTPVPTAARTTAPTATPIDAHPFLAESGLIDLGTFPGAAFGAAVTIGLRARSLRFEVAASYLPRARFAIDGGPTGASYRLLGFEGRLGYELFRNRAIVLAAMLGLEVARIDASSYSITDPSRDSVARASATFGVLGLLALSQRLWVRVHVSAFAPFRHAEFEIVEFGEVHREPAVGGRATLGLELDF